jgi:hypothetical protein
MSRNALADAVSFYDDLLQGDVLSGTHEFLQRVAETQPVTVGGRSLYGTLRPRFITPEQHADIQRATLAVSQALEAVARRATTDAAFRESLGPQGWEELLIPVDGHREGLAVVGRLDGFMGHDGVIRFIEYNPDPGGPIFSMLLGEAYDATPAMQAFSRRYDVVRPRTAPNLVTSLGALQAHAGRSGLPQLAYFGPPGPNDADEELPYREYLAAQGCPFRIVTSEDDWTYQDGVLRVGDFRVDVVTFASAMGFGGLVVGCGPEHPVMRALTDGAASFMNGLFRSSVLRSKALFAALSSLADSELFTPEQRGLLARHIPWTRVVREGHTDHHGERVDLLPFVAEHREQLVLKPAFEHSGTGVTLGWQTDAETWSTTLKQALQETWVVQERVSQVLEPYPFFDGGQVRFEERYSDLNPFVWNGVRQEGFVVRLSSNAMLNVAQGGSMTPLRVVRER